MIALSRSLMSWGHSEVISHFLGWRVGDRGLQVSVFSTNQKLEFPVVGSRCGSINIFLITVRMFGHFFFKIMDWKNHAFIPLSWDIYCSITYKRGISKNCSPELYHIVRRNHCPWSIKSGGSFRKKHGNGEGQMYSHSEDQSYKLLGHHTCH